MLSSFLTLGLFGLASAIPSHPIARRQTPNYPPTSQSNGFYLVANVTDLSLDFSPSINGFVVNSYHVGAAEAYAVLTNPSTTSPGRIFYENGTAYEVRFSQASVLTDGATPLSPYGLYVQNQTTFSTQIPTEHDVFINPGRGTISTGITGFPQAVAKLFAPLAAGWAACNNTLPYGPAFVIQPTYATYTDPNGTYDYQLHIPEGCVPITLMPQCTTLNTVPAGSYADHSFANTINCYDDVKGIDWSVYSDY